MHLSFMQSALAADGTVTLLQVNDVYKARPIMPANYGGLARLKTMVEEERAKSKGALFVLSGDFISPAIVSRETNGRSMVDALSMAGLDIASLGNHEFDPSFLEPERAPADIVRELITASNAASRHFIWLNSNLYDNPDGGKCGSGADGKLFSGTVDSMTKEINGVKVGVFAILGDTAVGKSGPKTTCLADPAAAAKGMVAKLKAAGAEVIVALTHQLWEADRNLAESVPGISVILGGHEHSQRIEFVNGVLISKCGSNAKTLCAVDATLRGGKVYTAIRILPVDMGAAEDPAVKAKMDQDWAEAMRLYAIRTGDKRPWADIVGNTKVRLDGADEAMRNQETNLGNFIADAVMKKFGAQAVILNAGSFRLDRDLLPGPITYEDALELDYYANGLVAVTVNGGDLRAALAAGISLAGQGMGAFPQIAGVRTSAHKDEKGAIVLDLVTVGGEPLKGDQTYRLATSCYMLKRISKGYGKLDAAKIEQGSCDQKDPATVTLLDVLIGALDPKGEINPAVDGRISIKY